MVIVNNDSVFITGHAKLPTTTTAEKLYEVIAVGIEVDDLGTIIGSDCTLATTVGRDFFKKLTIGYCFKDGIDPLIKKFEKRYYGSARKSIITALKAVYEKWQLIEKEKKRKA